jgi:PRTRC genetic system protein C
MANGTRVYRFGGEKVEAPASMTIEEVRQVWASVFPGVENASVEEQEDGSVDFVTRAGTKG